MNEATGWLKSMIEQLLQLSPPVILALVLYALGFGLKKSPLADWTIPLLLGVIGALVYPFVADWSKLNYEVKNPFILHGLYGVAIGAMPTWVHQSVRQFKNRPKHDDGGTKLWTKKDLNEKETPPTS